MQFCFARLPSGGNQSDLKVIVSNRSLQEVAGPGPARFQGARQTDRDNSAQSANVHLNEASYERSSQPDSAAVILPKIVDRTSITKTREQHHYSTAATRATIPDTRCAAPPPPTLIHNGGGGAHEFRMHAAPRPIGAARGRVHFATSLI